MKKKATLLFILRILKTGLGIVTLSVSSKYFGVSIARDEWLLSIGFIIVLDCAIWGPINETFRAKFIFLQHEIGQDESLTKAKSMFSFINIVTVFLVTVILIFPKILARILAPNYNQQEVNHLSSMIVLLIPSFLFNQISQFLTSLLNAYNVFYVPEITGFIAAVLNIIFVITLVPYLGIYTLAIGYYTGIILLLVFLALRLNKMNINVISNPFKFNLEDIKPFLLFSIPFFVPSFLSQFNNTIEKTIASTLGTGAVSIIDYSRRFSESVIVVLGSIITTMLLPTLCNLFSKKDEDAYVFEFVSMFQFSVLIMTFLVCLFSACPAAIISILYNKNIGVNALEEITSLSRLYSWGELAVLTFILFGIAQISTGAGKVYAIFGSIVQLVLVVLNLTLVKKFGPYTFPITLLITHLTGAICLIWKFPIKNNKILIATMKGLLQMISCSIILFLLNHYTALIPSINPFITIAINIILIVIMIFIFALFAKTDDLKLIIKLYSKLNQTSKTLQE